MSVHLMAALLLASTGQPASPAPVEPQPAQTVDLSVRLTGLGGLSDEYRGWRGSGGGEGALLFRWGRLELGPRLELDATAGGLSVGFGLLLGPTFALNERWSFDLLGELGAQRYSRDEDSTVILIDRTKVEGTSRTQLALGARAGFTTNLTPGRTRLSFGVFTRHAARTRVSYQEESCFLAWCSTTDHVARYGGLTTGGFLSWSWDFHLRAPPRSPDAPPDRVAEERP
jgi:hypothetical protein